MFEINGAPYNYKLFPDGTPLMRFDVDSDTDEIQYRILWKYERLEEQVILQNLVWHIHEKNPAAKVTLMLNYVPNARMDRTEKSDEVFTLKYFTRVINDLQFHRVYILDPHSRVAVGLLNRVHVELPKLLDYISHAIALSAPDILYYPDNGCQERMKGLISFPNLVGFKDRDWDSGQILDTQVLGLQRVHPADKDILIIDDICSYGGTFLFASKKLKELGAKNIDLYVTHCENSILAGDLIKSGLVRRIYTTDSLFTGQHELITVLKEGV